SRLLFLLLNISSYLSTLSLLDALPILSEDTTKEKIETTYLNKFEEVQQNEIDRRTTLIGPHRDDLAFYINHKDVKIFGSQGQQRDRKSTRLKSSHVSISYAVFCLKKKK